MSCIDDVINVFAYENINIEENLSILKVMFEIRQQKIDLPKLLSTFENISSRDELKLTLELTEDEKIKIIHTYNKKHNVIEYENKLQEIMSLCTDSDVINVNITINKKIVDGKLSIYNFDNFVDWLMKKSLLNIIDTFNELYEKYDLITFLCYDKDISIISETFAITNYSKDITFKCNIDRKEIIKNVLQLTYTNIRLNIVPNDFNIKISNNNEYKLLVDTFDKIRNILSLIYIADNSSIENDNLYIQIKGYRIHNFVINTKNNENLKANNVIYRLYNWIYSEANAYDKEIIARNIISLNCKYNNILELDNKLFDSVKSNYNYYLKDTTNDYLDKKMELGISITEKCREYSNIIFDFSNSLKGNFIAFFTYIATIVISNSFLNNRFTNIFTKEVTALTSIILIGSLFYLSVSLFELNKKYNHITVSIKSIKKSYEYLFDKDELNDLVDNNIAYLNSVEYFGRNRVFITTLWIIFVFILLLTLDYLSKYKVLFIFDFLNIELKCKTIICEMISFFNK